MTHDLTQMTATHLGKLYARGKASPVETMKAVLARTEAVNPVLNAFCKVDTEEALRAARASERRWTKGQALSPIDGVPVSIKELVRVKGWPASMGSKLTDKTASDADAPAAARLREAGAIVFAQSTSSEFGHKGVTDTPLNGVTRNPWNTDVTPGGSSGGAGAAVAAGLGPLAIGTDGGGSVRIPSSFNGLVGLKATYGRVPNWPPTLNGDFSNTGPMCRTALDCALMMNVIARPDPRDPTQLPSDDTDYVKALKHKLKKPRIAFLLRMSEHPLDIEVAAMVTKAAKQVEKLGCKVEEIDAPPFPHADAGKSFVTHWLTNSARLLDIYPEARWGEFDPNLLAGAKAARERYSVKDVVEAQAVRREVAVAWNLFFETYDFLLTPTVGVQPFPVLKNAPDGLDGKPNFAWSPYTATFNLTRHPAASVPCGLSSAGLPVGLQIVAGHFKDAAVLALAHAYAEAHPLKFPVLPETKQ
ncbi:amidase [Reyranella sp.]|uniref:amidase n=1 Tax=Reyranella sp. TaxID=1929291 RepID=UPI003D0A553B